MRELLLIAVVVVAGCGKSEKRASEKLLAKRRAIAAQVEDEMRRAGSRTKVMLRGVDETVIVVNGLVDAKGFDWCNETLWKRTDDDAKRPLSIEEASWKLAGITRLECESSAGRVFGYDLK
jgi:hypothetical protein